MKGPVLARTHPLYRRWSFMRQVCYNTRNPEYPKNGGRGIGIGPEFTEFWDFVYLIESQLGYPPGFSYLTKLARKDQSKDFTIKNLCWDESKQIGRRCSKAYLLRYRGKTKPLREWSEELGINFHTLLGRQQRGWPPAQILGFKPAPNKLRKQFNE